MLVSNKKELTTIQMNLKMHIATQMDLKSIMLNQEYILSFHLHGLLEQ